MPPKVKSWRDAWDTLFRQGHRENFDPSTPPACAEHLQFTLNGETRRAPGLPVTQPRWLGKTRTRWAKQYMVLPQTTLGQISIAPWTDQHLIQEKKRNWVISNKDNKETLQRGWCALSAEERGRGIPPRTVNKQAGLGQRGQGQRHVHNNHKQESLWEWRKEENSTGEGGRPTSHMSCKQTCQQAGAAAHAQQSGAESL
jgi:hypothetical protein